MSDLDIARGRSRRRSLLSGTASVVREPSGPSLKIQRKTPRPKRFRGTPPPLTFDLDALADSTLLNESETAAACRRAKSTLEVWRKQADHPLACSMSFRPSAPSWRAHGSKRPREGCAAEKKCR